MTYINTRSNWNSAEWNPQMKIYCQRQRLWQKATIRRQKARIERVFWAMWYS